MTTLPCAIDAEQAVLGAMLLERRALLRATEQAKIDDFYRPAHRAIFAALMALVEKTAGHAAEPGSSGVDLLFETVDELRCRGELEAVGGAAYLTALVEGCASAAQVESYLKPVLRTATQRRMIEFGRKLQQAAATPHEDIGPLFELIEREAIALGQGGRSSTLVEIESALLPAFEQLLRNYEQKGGVSGLPSGFADLDRKTTGFHPGNLIVVGARPGMGKSSFGLQIAEHVAREQGKPVAFFSLEMSMDEITQRLLAMHAGIDISSLRRGYIEQHFRPLGESLLELKSLPLYIDPTPAPTLFELRARAHRLAAEKGVSMVVVDYLQRLNSNGARGSRNELVGQFTRDLKSLARELHIPVVALAQINRGVEEREDKRPLKSDLRESGDIEAEADLILLLYRASYYQRQREPKEIEEAEILIDKNRQGPANCTVKLGWRGQLAQFVALEC